MLTKRSAEILNHPYEYTMRKNIVMVMEKLEHIPKQAKTLLRFPACLMMRIKNLGIERSMIHNSIKTRVDYVIKRENTKESK